jgi:hypothetical protein
VQVGNRPPGAKQLLRPDLDEHVEGFGDGTNLAPGIHERAIRSDRHDGSNRACGTYLCNHGTGYDGPSGLGARDTLRETSRRLSCRRAGVGARLGNQGCSPRVIGHQLAPEATPARHLGGGSAYQVRHSKTR